MLTMPDAGLVLVTSEALARVGRSAQERKPNEGTTVLIVAGAIEAGV